MNAQPKSAWPDGAACGVAVTVNLDAEAVDLREVSNENLFGRFSYGRYGMRAGLWRLLDVFRGHGLKVTFFVPGLDAERHPEAIEAILREGHEIGARGYAFEDHSGLDAAERDVLHRAHEALTKVAGAAPAGWRAPQGLLSPRTLSHLTELGYRYDSSFQDDDFPYVMRCGNGKLIVELPQFQALEDATLYMPRHSQARLMKTWQEEFDAIYRIGGFVNLTLHARGDYGSGRASRARVVDEFLTYMSRRPGVVFRTCRETAEWWSGTHPECEPAPL